ncbi:MAG: penicillin acylase family protein [Phycisphaerae bacterium]|nr:penicillin acylase family protein [Phycisphaerae bacterium]
MGRWLWRLTKWTALILLVCMGAALVAGRALLVASLPRESGEARLSVLRGRVEIERDDRAVPILRASSGEFADVAAGLGFVHAQDRFFQMDLMRRRAAGELSELLGPFALPSDRDMRRFRFRSVARAFIESLQGDHRAWIEAYAAGVNAGLADLTVRPPEYLALAQSPKEWLAEDCILAVLAMHHGLSMGARAELQNDVFTSLAPPGVARFLMPETARADHPLIGEPGDPLPPAPIPGPEALTPWPRDLPRKSEPERPQPLGSNNFAVDASLTADGRAILANDMHLQLSVPNTWYQAQLEWGGRRAVGATLPGVPGIVVGSNGHVAWGFTNLTGDFEDWVLIETDPKDPTRYRSARSAGLVPFGEIIEEIKVRGAAPEKLTLRTTEWGPVIQRDALGRPLVLKWPCLDPTTLNLNILNIVNDDTLEAAVATARSWWGPPQNVLIASSDGRIAWTISGWIPDRLGFDGRTPASWAAAGVGWAGPIDDARRPAVIDPPSHRLATANARTLPVEQSRVFGWCWAAGDRAARIDERLAERTRFDESALFDIQLDTRAASHEPIRNLILESVGANDPDPIIAMAWRSAKAWNGRADADSVGFRVIDRFSVLLHDRLLGPLWKQHRRTDPLFNYWCFQDDEPLMRILEERPAHMLPPGHKDWTSFFRATLRASLKDATTKEDYPADFTWGDLQRANIRHAFALAVPLLGRILNMPTDRLPGHSSTVRAQGRSFGASQRLVVSPSHEDEAIFHMPAGQSGHPLSPHYRDGHEAWVKGEPRPLLAGPPVSSFRLVPE